MQDETLHAEYSYPFEKVNVDIFYLDVKHYCVAVDDFPNFAEINPLPTISSRDVIIALKQGCQTGGSRSNIFRVRILWHSANA